MNPSFYRLAAGLFGLTLAATGCARTDGTEAAPRAAPQANCGEILCRGPLTVRVMTASGRVQETVFDQPLPIVIGQAVVTIYPGEKLFIEADAEGERLVNLTAVEAPRDLARTLVLTFEQRDNGDMFFTATNPFPKRVKYHLQMMLPSGDRLYETTSCPVPENGRFAIEHWPHPIFQLVLSEPHFIDGGGTIRCEY